MRVLLVAIAAGAALAGSAGEDVRARQGTPGPADRFVTVGGLRLHYLDWGTEGRQPLILVHGLDRTAHAFDHVAPHFVSRYHVLSFEMRGHGDSGWDPEGRYLVEDHVTDLEGFVRQLGLRNVILWGNSTGGRVVQVYAGMHPENVSHVISEDVGPERPRQIADGYARRVKEEEAGWATDEEVVARLRKANPRMPDANIRAWVRSGTRRRDDGRIVWKRDPKLVNGFVATDLWRFVSRIESPILYVLGGASSIVPPETQEQLRATLPRVEIVTMPGLGHYPSDEKPNEFLEIVDGFLARTTAR